ncbi:MarR family winged helix-turn-helix transcriptional regulator [Arthrobacter sp. NA-172]|uniref:MarR family winged helix-turn-helix transcriptional regulator n=1 Tax=Arthrobacter sp. NA-172 TaxID=3367524 RepID=UPI0037548A87
MSQRVSGIDLETSLGYLLKEASSALRTAMEAVLRPLGMSITHYSCLELLSQRPGLSNSDLARGTFVSRQSMNVLLQALERDGLVSRPEQAPAGRVLPTELTPSGRKQLSAASAAVKAVEDQMKSGLSGNEQTQLASLLSRCVASLAGGIEDAAPPKP